MSRWSLPFAVVLGCFLGPRTAGADKPAADEAVVMRYVELLKDDSALVRKRAALALKRMGPRARAALPALEKALTDKDKGVRQAVAEEPPVWSKEPPTPTGSHQAKAVLKMAPALLDLGKRLAGGGIETAVEKGLNGDVASRQLSIYALGAIDNVPKLLDLLGDAKVAHAADRDTAVFALRRWLSRNAGQGRRLYDPKTGTGLLVDSRRYNGKEAQILLDLLHHFSDRDRRSPDTFEFLARLLESPTVAIAHPAFWQLQRLAGDLDLPLFNAGASFAMRKNASDKVMGLIRARKLPPPERMP